MKSLKTVGALIILLFAFGLQVQGQRFLSSWKEFDWDNGPDSARFVRALGSVNEYNYQVGRAYDKEYRGKRIQFIDAKYTYIIWFVSYTGSIDATGYGVEVQEFPNRRVCTIGVSSVGERLPPVVVDLKINDDLRIQEADITGAPQTLLKIFKHQWWVSDDDMRAVQKGHKFTIIRLDEKVTFDWTGKDPKILIRRSGKRKSNLLEYSETGSF